MRKKNNKIIGKISLSSSINYPIVNISTNQGNKSYGEKIVHKRAKSTNKFRYIKNTQNINLSDIISNIPISKNLNCNINKSITNTKIQNNNKTENKSLQNISNNKTNKISISNDFNNNNNINNNNNNYNTNKNNNINNTTNQNNNNQTIPLKNKNPHSLSPQYYRYKNIYLLPPKTSDKKTLVLDLDETLVHSGFIPFETPSDVIIQIELENEIHDIHVLVRPYVKEFLESMSKRYELVIFTASLSKYANPLLNIIDKKGHCPFRLFREHCTLINTAFVKDLTRLGRDMKDIIIVDNSPVAYALNQYNGFPITSWFDDKNDFELLKIIPILQFLSYVPDVRDYIKKIVSGNKVQFDIVSKVIESYYNKLKNNFFPLSMRFFNYNNHNHNHNNGSLHKSSSTKMSSFNKIYSENANNLNSNKNNHHKMKYKRNKLSITNSNEFFNKNNIFNMNTMRYNSSTKKISFLTNKNNESKGNNTNGNYDNYNTTNVNKSKNKRKKKTSLDINTLKEHLRDLLKNGIEGKKNNKNNSQEKISQIYHNNNINSKSQRVDIKNKM